MALGAQSAAEERRDATRALVRGGGGACLRPPSLCDACPDAGPRFPRRAVNQQPVMHAHGPHKFRHGPAIRPETTVTWAPRRVAGAPPGTRAGGRQGTRRLHPQFKPRLDGVTWIDQRPRLPSWQWDPPPPMPWHGNDGGGSHTGVTQACGPPTGAIGGGSRADEGAPKSPTTHARADAVAVACGLFVATDHRRAGRGVSVNRGGFPAREGWEGASRAPSTGSHAAGGFGDTTVADGAALPGSSGQAGAEDRGGGGRGGRGSERQAPALAGDGSPGGTTWCGTCGTAVLHEAQFTFLVQLARTWHPWVRALRMHVSFASGVFKRTQFRLAFPYLGFF